MAITLTDTRTASLLLPSISDDRPQTLPEGIGGPVLTHHVPAKELASDAVDQPTQTTALETNQGKGSGMTLDTIPFQVLGDGPPPTEQGLANNEYSHHDILQRGLGIEITTKTAGSSRPFHKWIKTLHKRSVRRQGLPWWDTEDTPYSMRLDGSDSRTGRSYHRRNSSSGSSFGFVTAVKSASISLTTASVLSRSRRHTLRSSRGHSKADRSSRASIAAARFSEDSHCSERPTLVDPAVMERSLQRRRILEELISTEESYIRDVRFLINVYVTILASLPTLPPGLRSSINRNLTEIVELHEEMLGDLHRAVPYSEYTQPELQLTGAHPGSRGHQRLRSLDAVPEDRDGVSWLPDIPGLLADPQIAAEVAKIFSRKMNRFFVYEEYGAKYELMIKDVASAHRTMPGWQSYQKGLEVLASSLGSANSQLDHGKKSLTIGDLLVKPIQRVCKYPLLFAELLKYTPVVDCPYSHMEIENALIRLREATAEINRATDDMRVKSVLEKTWMLQDRLVFANHQLDAVSKNRIRSFGHVQLCGALHACWQTKEGVSGQYMVALLYREWFCLATAGRFDQIYTIQASIALNNIKVEEVDNGRGLQCHTAPYSWKIVFICDHQLYEMILTACTPKEELEWRSRLSSHQTAETLDQPQPALFSSISLNIKSLGTVFRKPGTIARRISIHRATTVGPKSPLCQVILKNTSVMKDAPPSSGGTGSSQINRSQSLLTTTSRIPVLAPSRGDRARLEALLSDVWTRDILPFPGMTARARSEHLVRASASSVIRKLSVVSIASSFTKRSGRGSITPVEEDAGFFGTSPPTKKSALDSPLTPATTASFFSRRNSIDQSEGASYRSASLLSVIVDEADREPGTSPSSMGTAGVKRKATILDWNSEDGDRGTEEVALGMVRHSGNGLAVRSTSGNSQSKALGNNTNLVKAAKHPTPATSRRSSANTSVDSEAGSIPSTTATDGIPYGIVQHQGPTSLSNLFIQPSIREDREQRPPRVGSLGNIDIPHEGDDDNGGATAAVAKENIRSEAAGPPFLSNSRQGSGSRPRSFSTGHRLSRSWTTRRGPGGHREAVVQGIKNMFR